MISHNLIKGANFTDERGLLSFFNAFEMNDIVRMYEIAPGDTKTIRAWQGHKIEKKWFYCSAGSFVINLIMIDEFNSPSNKLKSIRLLLHSKKPDILSISGGYATGFKALEENSKLLIFSDFNIEESKQDDFRFPINYWEAEW